MRIARREHTLHSQVANRLGARIVSGALDAGHPLPNEAALGEEFGVSRTVVREAIKVLAAKELLEVRPKTGTRIRPRVHWNVLDPDVLRWQFSGPGAAAGLLDLLEVRFVVEPAGARMAARRATRREVADIETACSEMEATTGDLEASIEPDLRFHLAVLAASHNAYMKPFGALIQAALRSSFRLTSVDGAAYRRSVRQHRRVSDAVRARDPEKAEDAMRRLLRSTSDDVHRILGATGSRPRAHHSG
jgi:DNA-binding FadR family transcriptional regulator